MVKMLSSGDGTPTIRSGKPVALNIVKKPTSSLLSASSTAVGSESSSPQQKKEFDSQTSATQAAISEAVGLGLRPMTQISIAESHNSAATDSPGRRARQSRTRSSHHTHDDAGGEDEDEDVHDRSRRSLLSDSTTTRTQIVVSPFTDDAVVSKTPTTPNPAALGQKKEEQDRNRGPFEDENSI
jgi:hypothetical protein